MGIRWRPQDSQTFINLTVHFFNLQNYYLFYHVNKEVFYPPIYHYLISDVYFKHRLSAVEDEMCILVIFFIFIFFYH